MVIPFAIRGMALANGQGINACLPFPVNSHSHSHSLKFPLRGGGSITPVTIFPRKNNLHIPISPEQGGMFQRVHLHTYRCKYEHIYIVYAPHGNTLHHTAPRCNTLQHIYMCVCVCVCVCVNMRIRICICTYNHLVSTSIVYTHTYTHTHTHTHTPIYMHTSVCFV